MVNMQFLSLHIESKNIKRSAFTKKIANMKYTKKTSEDVYATAVTESGWLMRESELWIALRGYQGKSRPYIFLHDLHGAHRIYFSRMRAVLHLDTMEARSFSNSMPQRWVLYSGMWKGSDVHRRKSLWTNDIQGVDKKRSPHDFSSSLEVSFSTPKHIEGGFFDETLYEALPHAT